MSGKKKVVFGGVPGMNEKLIKNMEKYVKEEYPEVEFVFYGEETLTDDEIIEKCKDAEVLISWDQEMNEHTYSSLNLKAYSAASTGFNAANVDEATKHNVVVTNVVDYCVDEVSTHALSLILSCVRKLYKVVPFVKDGGWGSTILEPTRRFAGSTVGLYGFGSISKRVAKKLSGFDVNVIASDPFVTQEEADKYNVKMVDFETLLKTSDYISIHAPLLESTKGIFNEKAFKLMKPSAYIINTARGGLINQDDLYKALKENWIAGAALDVLENEPPTEKDREIVKLPNTTVTSHCAFYSEESSEQQIKMTAEEVGRILRGEKPINVVNREVLSRVDWIK